jgi:PPIC-type PPIASE domain
MERWATTLVGFAVVVLAVLLVAHDYQPPKAIGHDPNPHVAVDAGDAGGEDLQAPMFALAEAGAIAEPAPEGGPLLLSDLVVPTESDRHVDGGPGASMLDGTSVPSLPPGAPREVRFGVVLVSYTGAQPSAGGAKPAARSRADAKALAAKLRDTAEQDFHAAVQQGDAGSADDLGRVKLGVLEPAPEYVLFTLGVGAIAGPVDTPRGYWIVKRLE